MEQEGEGMELSLMDQLFLIDMDIHEMRRYMVKQFEHACKEMLNNA